MSIFVPHGWTLRDSEKHPPLSPLVLPLGAEDRNQGLYPEAEMRFPEDNPRLITMDPLLRRQVAALVLKMTEVLNHAGRPPPSMVRDDVGAATPWARLSGPFGVGHVSPPLSTYVFMTP